jgi:protein-L-isoaspartate(D-aspartate) O-methyltransferase
MSFMSALASAYYTAILATLVGPGGAVTTIEFDSGLAARAAANFAQWPNVRVIQGDGGQVPFDPADVIYVNAGATRPAPFWLDSLKEGGRLILPLTTYHGFRSSEHGETHPRGAVFRVERRGSEFLARWLLGGGDLSLRGRTRRRIGIGSVGGFRHRALAGGHPALSP